jgi:membrane protease YdiL (CAAX protease family)
MPIRLTSRDHKTIIVAVLVAAVSLSVGVKYFSHAFPEASIEFRVNRRDSTPVAEKFLAERGWNVQGYRHAAVFQYDDDAKVYLERTQGLERMDQLTRGPIHMWRWSHRWFRPEQLEEFRVDVAPSGEVVGFDHRIPETASGANLDPYSARAIAEKFLTEVMKRNLDDLEFIEAESEKRPARTDHSFTWKMKNVNLGDGSYRLEVEVDGDQVASYQEYVKVPDQWSRDYQKLRSRNVAAQLVDQIFWILLSVAMLAILIQRLRDRDVPIRLAVAFGGVATLLYFLGQLNMFSLAQFGYRTTDSYSSFVTGFVRDNLLAALGLGAAIFLLMASSEPVYREAYPRFLSFRRYLSWQGLRSRSFLMANVVGIGMTFFFFAYQTVFYLAADKLGAWAPADVPFSDLLNTSIPWVTVLFIGFFPAVSEEMQFRAFAIPFVRRILRSAPAAVIVPAFIWGFLHSGYPNQPFFIRGLEVGFGGIIVGLVMLRFGILATLIWHYSVDALYTAFLLLRSPNHYLMISGAVSAGIMLVPLVVALIAYLRTRTFRDESPLTNAVEGVSRLPRREEAKAETTLVYQPLTRQRLILAGVLTVLFIATASMPVYRFGKGVLLRVSRSEVIRVADEFLHGKNVNPTDYHHLTWISGNVSPLALRYLLQRKSLEESDKIYREATRLELWKVRYFRPLQKEEFMVFVDPTSGEVFGFNHTLDENAPGASLTPEQAKTLAIQAIEQHGYRISDFELQNSTAEKRKAREDYTLVWQAKPGDPRNVGDAFYRLQVDIAGDQVVGFSRSFKLPEEWERERRASNLINEVLSLISYLTLLLLVGAALIVLIRQVRAGQLPWRQSLKVGIFLAAITLLSQLNQAPLYYREYDTSIPLTTFKLNVAVSLVVVPLVVGLLGWLLAGIVSSLYPDFWKVMRGTARKMWRRDAAVAALVSVAVGAGLSRVESLFVSLFHAYAPVSIDLFSDTLNTYLPALGFFLHAFGWALFYALIVGLVIYVVRFGWARRAWWLWLAALLVFVSLGSPSAHSVAEYAAGWILRFLPLAAGIAVVVLFFRDNVLAYIAAAFCLEVAEPIVQLLSQPAAFYRMNGILLAVLTMLTLAWLLLPRAEGGMVQQGLR